MPKKIKLSVISYKKKAHNHPLQVGDIYCRVCGEEVQKEEAFDEYVCSLCRHLAGKDDGFCHHCGGRLEETSDVEYFRQGKRLSRKGYEDRKTKLLKGERLAAEEDTK